MKAMKTAAAKRDLVKNIVDMIASKKVTVLKSFARITAVRAAKKALKIKSFGAIKKGSHVYALAKALYKTKVSAYH